MPFLTLASLAEWHIEQAANAALRAQTAQSAADAHRLGEASRPKMMVAADRQAAVAEAAHAEAEFHTQAASLVDAAHRANA